MGPGGQVLRQYRQAVQTGLNRIYTDLTELPNGFYIIQLSDPAKLTTKTFRVTKL
ncbi:MAG: hypothetical protein ACKO6Q_06390 [Bacteroidota bacterium]